jgi:hypothetical protein
VKPKGAPGLAFETWDPSNQFPLETPILLFVIRSKARDLQFSFGPAKSFVAEQAVRNAG